MLDQISQTTLPAKPIRAGRPTREQAKARVAELLDCAFEHFLDKGFDATTIDAIAADVSMTKRTVYSRYPDKTALFREALRRGAEKYAVNQATIEATRGETLEQTLINLGMLRISLAATPQGMKLQRLINTESYRFPDIFRTYYDVSALPSMRFLAKLLEAETEAGRLAVDDTMLAANIFMSMVASGPVRLLLSGTSLPEAEVGKRVRFAVQLFLKGVEPR